MAASLHDWDDLIPVLEREDFAAHALDLLGHGGSLKPDSRSYQVDWLYEHLAAWMASLHLEQPAVLVGHSLGGYLALEAARLMPEKVRGLVLVNPFFRQDQLPPLLRLTYRRPGLNLAVMEHLPDWLLRAAIDVTSLSIGHGQGGAHNLPARVRAQTALDYKRTAPGVYHIPNSIRDLTPGLSGILQPTLLVWGANDLTLSPASFQEVAGSLPCVQPRPLPAGHVPHQSHAREFNSLVLDFLQSLPPETAAAHSEESAAIL